jgi:hypothetical protein
MVSAAPEPPPQAPVRSGDTEIRRLCVLVGVGVHRPSALARPCGAERPNPAGAPAAAEVRKTRSA